MKNRPNSLSIMLVTLGGATVMATTAAQTKEAEHQHQEHSEHAAPPTMPRTPIPPVTDKERSTVFLDTRGHAVHDRTITTFLLLDQLEWQDAEEGDALSWDATGWIGNDIHRLWFRSEGERSGGETEEATLQLLWGEAIGAWWEVVTGVRHDFKPGAAQTWGAIGIQGLALYDFEIEATLYLGEGAQTAVRLAGEYDILLTNRLVLQPTAEVNFYGKNDRSRAVGAGLADAEIGLRLRYEIRREIAPYIGFSWRRLYGETADYNDAHQSDARLVIGIRAWY